MANNFYEQFLEAQNSMFNTWSNYMNPMVKQEREEVKEEEGYFESLKKLNEKKMNEFMENPSVVMQEFMEQLNPLKSAKMGGVPIGNFYNMMTTDPMEKLWKNMMGFNQLLMNQNFENPQDVWKKMNASFDNYVSAYQLWKKLSDASNLTPQKLEEISTEWTNQYNNYMKNYFIPILPKELQDVTGKYLDAGNAFGQTIHSLAKPFVEDAVDVGTVMADFAKKGPKAYMDYMNMFTDNAKESFNYLSNTPFAFHNEDFIKTQQKLMDRWNKYSNAIVNYQDALTSLFTEASKSTMEDFSKVLSEGMEPKSFEEFYKFWTDKRNEYVEKAYMSEEFKGLMEETLDAMTDFKEENEDIMREYFSFLQIPKKNDVDKLEERVLELTAKIDEMNKEISEMKNLLKEKRGF
ncbi:MAG: poly(R)-hydroxyalkanoic acid synthase subunit PhaE [Tissierellia bacterium]|nr:poly(R)-hydroxyalkanoic acid synthase subunit PhaE [Tissierellia bacterium]